MVVTTQTYGQFLLNGMLNFTGTFFASIAESLHHDSVWRFLNGAKLSSKVIFEKAKQDIVYSSKGYLIFDDSVLDKSHSKKIEIARWQYSGNTHKTVMGIGVVNCVYYNPELDRYWIIDARIYQPDQDGKKKYIHVEEMLLKAIERGVVFRTVLMDTWYAIQRLMYTIDTLGYKFVCPIRSNRQILDLWTDPDNPKYRPVKELPWKDEQELKVGKTIKLRQCSLKMKLFRISVHPNRTDYVVTNDFDQINTSQDATKACAVRWNIEQYHREVKQLTGIGKCQARNGKAQRKHINVAILTWLVLNAQAHAMNKTIYQVKEEPLKMFQAALWRRPHIAFSC